MQYRAKLAHFVNDDIDVALVVPSLVPIAAAWRDRSGLDPPLRNLLVNRTRDQDRFIFGSVLESLCSKVSHESHVILLPLLSAVLLPSDL